MGSRQSIFDPMAIIGLLGKVCKLALSPSKWGREVPSKIDEPVSPLVVHTLSGFASEYPTSFPLGLIDLLHPQEEFLFAMASTTSLPSGHKVCKNHMSYNYTGKESSPQGLGYCAEGEEMGVVMVGRDKHNWMVGLKQGLKTWTRIPDTKVVAKKEIPPMAPTANVAVPVAVAKPERVVDVEPDVEADAEADAEADTDAESDADPDASADVDAETEELEEEPVPEPVKPKAKPVAATTKPAAIAKPVVATAKPATAKPATAKPATAKPEEAKVAKPAAEAAPAPKKKPAVKKPEIEAEPESEPEEVPTKAAKAKRAPTQFNLYIKDTIAQLRESEPGLAQKEYMAKAAAMWNDYKVEQGMPETKKRPVKTDEEKAAAKQRKADKKAAASEDGDNESVASGKSKASSKDKGPKVKRAPTAYNIYVREKIAELKAADPGLEPKKLMAMAAAAYRESKAVV